MATLTLDLAGPIDHEVWHLGSPFFRPEVFQLEHSSGQTPPYRSEGIRMPMLTGTYLETSAHLLDDGEYIIDLAPERFVSVPAVCVQVERGARQAIGADALKSALSELDVTNLNGMALVVSTGWWRRWSKPEFLGDSPFFTTDAIDFVVSHGVAILGSDSCMFDDPHAPTGHLVKLFASGALLLSPLYDTERIGSGRGQLTAAPLKIAGVTASPVRAMWSGY